jgi:hypothetical protein
MGVDFPDDERGIEAFARQASAFILFGVTGRR